MSFSGFGNTQQSTGATGGGLLGGSAFGSSQTNVPGGSLFGNTNANQQTSNTGGTGGGLFGATNTNNQAGTSSGGGLFGSTQPSGGLFGNTNTANQQQATASAATSGSLFGAQTGNAGGGLFGNNNSNQTAGASGGGLFGNNSTGNTSTQAAPSSGLFGSNTTATNTAGGGSFGSNTSTNSSGNMFGSTGNTSGTTGGSLFGTQPIASAQQPSLFGNTNQSSGSSLFGTTQQPQQQQSGSLFGQQKPTGGLFGSTLGGSLFGGASNTGANSLLSSTTNNLFASKPAPGPSPQQDAQIQYLQLLEMMQTIQAAWNPNSPLCRFQHYFYNLVNPDDAKLYGRPANATNDALWQKAINENPDRSCHVPVIATGFEDLQKRVEAQTQQAAEQQQKIKDLQSRISALVQRHQLSNASRLQRASVLQTQVTHRVLKLVQHLHLLIPALRSSALRPEEEALRTALEEIDEEVRRPGGTGRIRGKLNELWALVGAVTAARERDRRPGEVEWRVVDEDGLAQITQILAEEQTGLAHLTNLLQKDLKDLAVVLGKDPKEYDSDLISSTATLRGSTF